MSNIIIVLLFIAYIINSNLLRKILLSIIFGTLVTTILLYI